MTINRKSPVKQLKPTVYQHCTSLHNTFFWKVARWGKKMDSWKKIYLYKCPGKNLWNLVVGLFAQNRSTFKVFYEKMKIQRRETDNITLPLCIAELDNCVKQSFC